MSDEQQHEDSFAAEGHELNIESLDVDADAEKEKKIQKLEEELKEYKDKYLRVLAEMENARKRLQKEKQDMIRFASENVIADILGPLDNLEQALSFAQNMSEEIRKWAMGFQMIVAQFKDVLQNHGVVPFNSEGTPFDPHKHEAVETEETDKQPEGTVIQEFVKGYKSGDRTIRPARVKVAKASGKDGKEPSAHEKKLEK
jgi:molecular chaperone GrpE